MWTYETVPPARSCARVEDRTVERALLVGHFAMALVDDLRRKLGEHLLLRPAKDEGPHQPLQRAAVRHVAGKVSRHDEIEKRPQLVFAVLDRRAGQPNRHALVE